MSDITDNTKWTYDNLARTQLCIFLQRLGIIEIKVWRKFLELDNPPNQAMILHTLTLHSSETYFYVDL